MDFRSDLERGRERRTAIVTGAPSGMWYLDRLSPRLGDRVQSAGYRIVRDELAKARVG